MTGAIATLRDYFVTGLLRRTRPELHNRIVLADAYQKVFGDRGFVEGQLVFRDIMHAAGVLNIDTDLTGDEAIERCAKRAIGMHILQRLRWSAGELAQLGEEVTYDQLAGMAGSDQFPGGSAAA